MDRTRVACDRCHKRKIKCFNSIQGCRQCADLGIVCKSERPLLKPGRKPTAAKAHISEPRPPGYPVLHSLRAHGVGDDSIDGQPRLCSTQDACYLLENFFSSPDQIPHGVILRRASLLRSEGYRECTPSLLLSILCLACYMSTVSGEPPLVHLGQGDRARLRNALHARCLALMEPVFLHKTEPCFDDAITTFMLCSISTSDDENHKYLPHRLMCFYYLMKQLQINVVPEGTSVTEEEREERCRLWWGAYVVDKHSSFSFNWRPTLAESECRYIRRPCRDEVWLADGELYLGDEAEPPQGLGFEVISLDWFGIFVPLAAILSDILEYHYLLQHPSLGSNKALHESLRASIVQNMGTFDRSVRDLVARARRASRASQTSNASSDQAGVSVMVLASGQLRDLDRDFEEECPSEPKLLLYAWHMLHCMYTILYGKLDPVDIFQDTDWLLSKDFLVAAEHADKCTKVTAQILRRDPKLHQCYRLFGTYFLHSSFIFLSLARKLRHSADEYILNSCRTYLRTLDAFQATVNIKYQKTFARVLQDTIARCVEAQRQLQSGGDAAAVVAATAASDDDWLDPALLNYRWTVGHRGLWNGDMGRHLETKKQAKKHSDV